MIGKSLHFSCRHPRLLTLTGARREEIGALGWDEVDLELRPIASPGARTKNKRLFDIPLCEPALAILRRRRRGDGRELVFGERSGALSGWSSCKSRLDERIGDSHARRSAVHALLAVA